MTMGVTDRAMVETIARQDWLEPVDKALGQGVASVFKATGPLGRPVKNFLHGTWLGHPLHPVLTDVPLGAWTVALVLDLIETVTGRDDVGPGADAAVGIGLLGAVGAALAGVTDWEATEGKTRRVGLTHGLLNLGVTGLYGASLLARRQGARGLGRGLAFVGFAISNYSAYLGGYLVYNERIGATHSHDRTASPPDKFVPVLAEADLAEGALQQVDAQGTPVVLTRLASRYYALDDTCSHLGCSLAEGDLEGESLRCPCHGSRFALADGRVLDGPATLPQPAYETRVRDGQIEVRLAQ